MSRNKSNRKTGKLSRSPATVLGGLKSAVIYLFVLSGVVNVLALTGSIYMLQIYDRALTSQSVPTLLALSTLAIGLYLIQGVLDVTRSQILVRLGARFDQELAPLAHKVAIDMPRFGFSTSESLERSRDVDNIRHCLASQGPIAAFDLPWMPLYVAFVYFLHPVLGMLALGGAVILSLLTLLTEVMTQAKSAETLKAAIRRGALADSHARNAEVLHAMGFADRAVSRYDNVNREHLELQTRTNDITGSFSGISKVLRMILQSAVLGVGAFLTIQGDLTAGAIIAASVATARALAPVDLIIGQWKNIASARRSYTRLGETLAVIEKAEKKQVALQRPSKTLGIEKITVAVPGTGTVVLADVGFELKAGQALGLIGPSGGGKSSLVRGITGIWPLIRGNVRLDGASIDQWPRDVLGSFVGYLPQEVALLDGTIAENISRFDDKASDDKILEAARTAGVHDLIVHLPDGYQTELGAGGNALSAGQRQRIALARALYDKPFLVILDEPNSNLDAEGDEALTAAIESVRARGGITIVVAHRPSALVACDMVGVVQGGRLAAFGAKDMIINANTNANGAKPKPATPKKVANLPNHTPAAGRRNAKIVAGA